MITVTRPNGQQFSINPDLLQRIDAMPATVLTLVDGTRYAVEESMAEVIDRVTDYRAALLARAQDTRPWVDVALPDAAPPSRGRASLRSVPPQPRMR